MSNVSSTSALQNERKRRLRALMELFARPRAGSRTDTLPLLRSIIDLLESEEIFEDWEDQKNAVPMGRGAGQETEATLVLGVGDLEKELDRIQEQELKQDSQTCEEGSGLDEDDGQHGSRVSLRNDSESDSDRDLDNETDYEEEDISDSSEPSDSELESGESSYGEDSENEIDPDTDNDCSKTTAGSEDGISENVLDPSEVKHKAEDNLKSLPLAMLSGGGISACDIERKTELGDVGWHLYPGFSSYTKRRECDSSPGRPPSSFDFDPDQMLSDDETENHPGSIRFYPCFTFNSGA
ncbi:hypothetical protein VKT23_015485 [Stygiomarasmius scandens]|uniref:Uncharacterized protein n=1 Tax=Marasmiellus scandens TaxID=2682957 RepID=A0ABR1J161_9AGAR